MDVCVNEQTFLIMGEISYCFNYLESDYIEASSPFQLLLDFSAAIVSKKPQLESHWSRLVEASVRVPAVAKQAKDFVGMRSYSQLHLCSGKKKCWQLQL